MTWNPARVEALEQLWADGLTGQQIADALGVSRSAVVARAHRLGLKRRIAGGDDEKFDRVIDLVANAPLNAPRSPRDAAMQVGLVVAKAEAMWADICRRHGESPKGGDHVVRPL